jgi:glycosyltransferase involved in cell wall biosynthesis
MMEILVFTQYFYPENFRVNALCAELVRRGHGVTVLTGFPQYPYGTIYEGYGFHIPYVNSWKGVRIERLRVVPRGNSFLGMLMNCWSYAHQGAAWVRRCSEKYDAIFVFEVSPVTVGLPAVKYKEKFGTPIFFNLQDLWPENVEVVLGIHNRLVISLIERIVDRIYGASDIILCASMGFKENLARRGVQPEKLVYWPQFCEEPIIGTASKPDLYSDAFFNIVFAGNIGDAQGLDLLVESAEVLRGKPVRWYIVGDGRARKRIEEKVERVHLDEQVIFIGRVSEDDANRYIHFADCAYLSFSDNRVFDMTIPAKLQTYLACGTMILGAVGGESEKIIVDNRCGMVAQRSADSIKEAIEVLVDTPKRKLQEMNINAKDCYNRNYRMDSLIDQLESIIHSIQEKRPNYVNSH